GSGSVTPADGDLARRNAGSNIQEFGTATVNLRKSSLGGHGLAARRRVGSPAAIEYKHGRTANKPPRHEGKNSVSNDEREVHPRTLAAATVLQIVPALREEPVARTALNVAAALREIGARAIVAGEDGPLVEELTGSGGEWVPLVNATVNPFQLRRSARTLERLIASERIDIVHAQSAGGAWIANMAAAQTSVWLVTTLPDVPPASHLRAYWAAGLARGDWVITASNFAAAPLIAPHKIPPDRATILPRSIDIAAFDPAAVEPASIGALRKAWRIPPAARILLVPGRVAPWNGQLIVPEIARIMLDSGMHGFVFVLAGEYRSHRKYTRA